MRGIAIQITRRQRQTEDASGLPAVWRNEEQADRRGWTDQIWGERAHKRSSSHVRDFRTKEDILMANVERTEVRRGLMGNNYKFKCTCADGSEKSDIEVTYGNDNEALEDARNQCEGQCGGS